MILNRLIQLRTFSSYTIFNKSSGSGKCGIAVVRVSGDKTREALKALTGSDNFKPRYATYKKIRDPETQEIIDSGLVFYYPYPKSFTGEDSCEFQVHGGIAVVTALLNALGKVKGLRLSEPGEFSKRAFLNNKIDLTAAEGIADLIHAETEMQRKQALIQAEGHLSRMYQDWRQRIIRSIAHFEAYIDFSEDEQIEENVLSELYENLIQLKHELQKHLLDGRMGERLREGVKVVIVGETNVGKSSLMNILTQRDVSIVTSIAGTTRDVIETSFEINGYPVILADSAGLRESTDIVESEGIRRAKKCALLADLLILVIDGCDLENYFSNKPIDIDHYREIYLQKLGLHNDITNDKKMLTIVNKRDMMSNDKINELDRLKVTSISCQKLHGIDNLVSEMTKHLRVLCGDPSAESPYLSQQRHRQNIQECLHHIQEFLNEFDPSGEQDLAILVQHLRCSVRCIGRITGEVRTDDILDVIFKDFCIGK